MRTFQIEQSAHEIYTPHAGLALVGLALNRYTRLRKTLRGIPKRHGIPNIELIRAYVGQLCLGKSDFEAIDNARHDPFFRQALGIRQMPSAARLRQRLDQDARALIDCVDEAAIEFVRQAGAPVTPLATGHVALDIDVFPMDNSGTRKEGVSRTYHGYDGYAPIAAYLGREGWCLALELREGSWHSQKEFEYVLERVIPLARDLTGHSVLVRLDSAHDALDNRAWLVRHGVDLLIKWNPRGQDPAPWLDLAEQEAVWSHPRPGKRVGLMEQIIEETREDHTYTVRRVIRIIERTIDRHGQYLLEPQIELEGWWTTLDPEQVSAEQVIALYRDHATCEQFHSEFKTDLDLERLPSGKFDTNDLVLSCAALAYNILRWIGLNGLLGQHAPVRHKAKRRRLRTVIQELMILAARMVHSARRTGLRFSAHCPGFASFRYVYQKLAYT